MAEITPNDVINARIDGIEKAMEQFHDDLVRVPTQLDRAIVGLRDLLESKILALSDMSEQRFMFVNAGSENMMRLWNERQRVLDERFETRDKRAEETVNHGKVTVDVALDAAKEAMAKIEANFTKSIDSQQALLTTVSRASDDKIGDLKDRVTAMESRTAGITTASTENRIVTTDNSTRLLAILAIIVSTAIGIGEILTLALRH